MYQQKNKDIQIYQLMRDIYSFQQEELMVSKYYRILKSKWEDVDYLSEDTWKSIRDKITHWNK